MIAMIITTTTTAIIMFLFLSGPANISIALSLFLTRSLGSLTCNADSDDPGQGFQFECGHHSNRRRAVLARRHVHGVTALVRRQDRIVWLRSFACCLLST